ncbi:chitobiase/beta-hexosaminidase C-terminal domain-containing protein [Bacillus sp. FSL K6-3431]|uniref:chitobiase/beta-hexosaminidase C-terminal domain-containing protein n=1 Tax=Bacillus sp. FSL K6-3431 TaxID=2921500 RepID=UPI0030F7159E
MRNILAVEVDLKGLRRVPVYTVTQNDSVRLIVSVLDEGIPFKLDEVSTNTLVCTRTDKETIVTAGTQTGLNEITFDLGTSEIAVLGKVDAVIQLYTADERVSTIKFAFIVIKDPSGDGFVPSDREQSIIEVVLGSGPLVIKQAQEASTYIEEKKPLIDKLTDEQTGLQAQLDESKSEIDNAKGAFPTLIDKLNDMVTEGGGAPSNVILFEDWVGGESVNIDNEDTPPADTTPPMIEITSARTFTDTQIVTMTTDETADIWYTKDSTDPKTSATRAKYTFAITLTETTTIKVYAVDIAGNASVVQTVTYTKQAITSLDPFMAFDAIDGTLGSSAWNSSVGGYKASLINFSHDINSGWNNGYLLFDSINDTVSIPATSDLTVFNQGATIELLFRAKSETGTGNIILLDAGSASSTTRVTTLPGNKMQLNFGYINTADFATYVRADNIPFALGELTHVVMTSEVINARSCIKVYVNGVLVSTVNATSDFKSWTPIAPSVKLFSYIQRTAPTELKLLKMYKTAMRQQQVTQIYDGLGVR